MLENTRTKIALFGTMLTTALIVGMGSASATTADPVDTAFNDMESKVTQYGGAIVALVVASLLIFLGVKYLRKGLSKA